jgi:VWFA-related protein
MSALFQSVLGQAPETVIRSNVREVLLDVVVRHKDMSLVKKLKASDFTVTEDGVPQTIKTFRFVGGRDAQIVPRAPELVGPAVEAAAAHANSTREPNFVSIVFDRIGPDSRKNALEAAADFIEQEFQTNTYAAIFGLNLRLNAVQGFTNDRAALREAVRRAVTGNAMELASASAGVLNQTDFVTTAGPGGISTTPGIDITRSPDMATSSASQAPLSESQQAIAGIIADQRDMEMSISGMQVLTALMRLVQYESRLPGRKTVLYLSEGLTKPPNNPGMMRAVVSAANRGNVSFYCIDVRGLTMGGSNSTVAGLTQTAAGISQTQSVMSSSPSGAKAQDKEMDLIQDSLASHVQLNMAELAEGTGGFAIFNTNNFKSGMQRVMEDVRTHYEISYVPASTLFDGHFRRIKVTVHDPKLVVQSRDGYYAVPETSGPPVLPYEMAGLRALNEAPHSAFPFHASAMRFKPAARGFRYEMAFDVDTASLTTNVDPNTHMARIHVVFLALIKDPSGQIVNKVSREIDREVPEDKLEQFWRGQIIFTSPFEAGEGRYTVEAAVLDPEGGRASTRRFALVVPKPGEPAVSSIAVVRRLDPLDAPRDPGNPLEFDGGKVFPELAQDARSKTGAALFFVVYPRMDGSKPKVTVELFQDGKPVSRTEPDPGSPDEVNSFPMIYSSKLPPGDYVVRITAEQSGRVSHESASITVSQ